MCCSPPCSLASSAACPRRGARFLLLPLSLPAIPALPGWGRGCRDFLPLQPGILCFSCSGEGEVSAGQRCRPLPAAASGRSGTSGLSCCSQFSTGSVCWVGTDPSSAPSQIFPHSHNVSTSVSAQNASQETALDCFHAQAKRRDEPCSQRHMEVITGITTTLPSTGCG